MTQRKEMRRARGPAHSLALTPAHCDSDERTLSTAKRLGCAAPATRDSASHASAAVNAVKRRSNTKTTVSANQCITQLQIAVSAANNITMEPIPFIVWIYFLVSAIACHVSYLGFVLFDV